MPLIDPSWLPPCDMKRVICHWTGGAHRASSLDRLHYHFLVEADGKIVRGEHSITDNISLQSDNYAAHTRGCNSGSIGISMCCMANAQEQPFRPGPAPMTEVQFHAMAKAVAELCRAYGIPVTPRTVLGHGEVQVNLGIEQSGKWDPLILPWNTAMPRVEVARYLRGLVQTALDGGVQETEPVSSVQVTFRGKPLGTGRLVNGESVVEASKVASVLECTIDRSGTRVRFVGSRAPEGSFEISTHDGVVFVDVEEVARRLGYEADWDAATRTVRVK